MWSSSSVMRVNVEAFCISNDVGVFLQRVFYKHIGATWVGPNSRSGDSLNRVSEEHRRDNRSLGGFGGRLTPTSRGNNCGRKILMREELATKLNSNQTYLVSQTESTSWDEIQVGNDLVCVHSREILHARIYAEERICEKARFKNSVNKQRDENKHWRGFWWNARVSFRRGMKITSNSRFAR